MSNSVVIQQASSGYRKLLDLTHERHAKYCERHDFTFWSVRGKVLNHPDRGPTWCRLALIHFACLAGYDWIVCLDADTLIMNMNADFRESMPKDANIGMVKHPRAHAGREWHWNCGVIVTRRASAKLWPMVLNSGKVEGQTWNEQSRINDISLRAEVLGGPEPFTELDAKWNSADHINPCERPVVKAWHGLHMAALPLMKAEMDKFTKPDL